MLAKTILGCLVAGLIATAANAEPSPEAMALARRYVVLLDYAKNLRVTMDAAAPSIVARRTKGRLSKKQEAAILEAASETLKTYSEVVQAKMTPIIAETFTEQELRDLIAFQESAAGRALKEKMPAVSLALQAEMKDLAPQISADIQNRYCRKVTCDPPGGKAAKPQTS